MRVNRVARGRLALINCILLLLVCGLITVSITIIVIAVNLDLAFCCSSRRVRGTLLPRGSRCLTGVCACAAASRRAQTFEVVNRLGDKRMAESSFRRHPHIKFPFDAFLRHNKTRLLMKRPRVFLTSMKSTKSLSLQLSKAVRFLLLGRRTLPFELATRIG